MNWAGMQSCVQAALPANVCMIAVDTIQEWNTPACKN